MQLTIRKVIDHKVGTKEYHKYLVTIPAKYIKEHGLREGSIIHVVV